MSQGIPREAVVIRLAREAMDMTALSAAEASRAHDGKGISAAYWRDVERGYGGRRGQRVATRASARALAAMARVVGVQPAQLAGAGREDAARVLAEALRRDEPPALAPPGPPQPPAAPPGDTGGQPILARVVASAMEKVEAELAEEFALTEAGVWEEISRAPKGTPPAAIFTHPAEAALMGMITPEGEPVPLPQRVRWISEFRVVRARPSRAAPESRRAG